MNKEGPYRNDPITKTLDDHDGRLDVLEYFIDGRARCTGGELRDKFDVFSFNTRLEIKHLKIILSVLILGLAAWIFIDLLTMEGLYREQERKIDELETRVLLQDLEIKSLRSALKCISEHSYKIAEARDSL